MHSLEWNRRHYRGFERKPSRQRHCRAHSTQRRNGVGVFGPLSWPARGWLRGRGTDVLEHRDFESKTYASGRISDNARAAAKCQCE
jgi:hypothetical protein